MKNTIDYVLYKNTVGDDKPNEDIIAINNGIGCVLDGVSRDRENGIYPYPSPATDASQIFANEIISDEAILGNGLVKLQTKVLNGNSAIAEYNSVLKHRFPAGTVGVVFSIEDDLFNYCYIGDCYAMIIRDDKRKVFTEVQTKMIANREKGQFTSDEIRFDICNHISNPYGYGVWDGNEAAMDFVKYGVIKIRPGDLILIYTDGLAREMEEKSNKSLLTESLENLFGNNKNKGMDDRSCLRITVKGE